MTYKLRPILVAWMLYFFVAAIMWMRSSFAAHNSQDPDLPDSTPSAELYDPATGHFTATDNMIEGRAAGAAIKLQDGSVIMSGGQRWSCFNVQSGADSERYDPRAGTFTPVASFPELDGFMTISQLGNGRVLAVGGTTKWPNGLIVNLKSLESLSTAPGLCGEPVGHTATVLADGQVIITGGFGFGFSKLTRFYNSKGQLIWLRDHCLNRRDSPVTPLYDALSSDPATGPDVYSANSIYDPRTNTLAPDGHLTVPRYGHTATRLQDGRVLIAGGFTGRGFAASAELYDPDTHRFTATGSMAVARIGHTATLLPDGKVLITGGFSGADFPRIAELYDPAAKRFLLAGEMNTGREDATATLLSNGRVLITGGFAQGRVLASAEIYAPGSRSFRLAGPMTHPRIFQSATLLDNGKVLIAGGRIAITSHAGLAQVYNPDNPQELFSLSFESAVANMLWERRMPGPWEALPKDFVDALSWTRLGDGGVFKIEWTPPVLAPMFPGQPTPAPLFLKIWDAMGHSISTPPMAVLVGAPAVVTLNDGKVLVAGGRIETGAMAGMRFGTLTGVAQLYDPATNRFRRISDMLQPRASSKAVHLLNGKVLIFGGGPAQAEIYDPTSQRFNATGNIGFQGYEPLAAVLKSGKVLVAGGVDFNGNKPEYSPAEIYNPSTGRFDTTDFEILLNLPAVSPLSDGKVLFLGSLPMAYWLPSLEPEHRGEFAPFPDPCGGAVPTPGGIPTPLSPHAP